MAWRACLSFPIGQLDLVATCTCLAYKDAAALASAHQARPARAKSTPVRGSGPG